MHVSSVKLDLNRMSPYVQRPSLLLSADVSLVQEDRQGYMPDDRPEGERSFCNEKMIHATTQLAFLSPALSHLKHI